MCAPCWTFSSPHLASDFGNRFNSIWSVVVDPIVPPLTHTNENNTLSVIGTQTFWWLWIEGGSALMMSPLSLNWNICVLWLYPRPTVATAFTDINDLFPQNSSFWISFHDHHSYNHSMLLPRARDYNELLFDRNSLISSGTMECGLHVWCDTSMLLLHSILAEMTLHTRSLSRCCYFWWCAGIHSS